MRASGVVACGLQELWCAGSVVVARGLWSAGSVVVVHGLRCSAVCGIFPDQGSNPCPLPWQTDSQPLRHQGSPTSHVKPTKQYRVKSRKSPFSVITSDPLVQSVCTSFERNVKCWCFGAFEEEGTDFDLSLYSRP